MFSAKKDRQIVELHIEFNLSAINQWLAENGSIADIEKMDREWSRDAVTKSYDIDVLPNGLTSDMYFHRQKGVVSGNMGGCDYLGSGGEDLVRLGWQHWRTSLCLDANKKPILLVPTVELAVLQATGELENWDYKGEEQKVKVPISYESGTSSEPKEFIEIWRGCNGLCTVFYGNAFALVSASTRNGIVEYMD